MPFRLIVDQASKRRAERLMKEVGGSADKILISALNIVSRETRKTATEETAKDVRLKKAAIKAQFISAGQRPSHKARKGRLRSMFSTAFKGLRLYTYIFGRKPKPGIPGKVKVKVKSKGGAKTIDDAFIITLKRTSDSLGRVFGDQKFGIFVRDSQGKLDHLHGPSPSQVINREINTGFAVKMQRRFNIIFVDKTNETFKRLKSNA